MTEEMLRKQIKRYENDAIRYKKHGDRYYAAYMESGDKNAFLNSQRFYQQSKKAEEICENYKAQMRQLQSNLQKGCT